MTDWIALDVVSFWELLLRVMLAIFFGLSLGIDREFKGKTIDFKAYMIIAASSCVVAVLGQEIYQDYATAEEVVVVDLSRIVAGVLTGIGFLGAGAIIKVGDRRVMGTATGASIWASGVIGLALGFGFYGIALVGFFATTLILTVFGQLERPSKSHQDGDGKDD